LGVALAAGRPLEAEAVLSEGITAVERRRPALCETVLALSQRAGDRPAANDVRQKLRALAN
jgi:hypothetical protein